MITPEDRKFLKKMATLMGKAPEGFGDRVRCFTIGDSELVFFDAEVVKEQEDNDKDYGTEDEKDLVHTIDLSGCEYIRVYTPTQIEGVCG